MAQHKGRGQVEEGGTFEIPTLRKTTPVKTQVQDEQEMIRLKKIPSVLLPDVEEEEKPQKVTKTTVFDVEEMVRKEVAVEMSVTTSGPAEEKKPPQKADVVEKPEIKKPKEEEKKEAPPHPWSRQKGVTKEEKPEDKTSLKRTPKAPKQEDPGPPGAALKKAVKLPSHEAQPEVVRLKPVQRPVEPVEELEKDKKERPDKDSLAFQKGDRILTEVEAREPATKHEKAPAEVKEPTAKVLQPADKKKTPEKETEAVKAPTKVKKLPTHEQEVESVKLKPFSRPSQEAVEPEKEPPKEIERKATDDLQRPRISPDETLKEKAARHKKPEIPEAPEKKPEKEAEKEAEPAPVEKMVPRVPVSVKKPEMVPGEPKPLQLKKGVAPKAKEEKEEVALKPLEKLKKVELKKTPSPKVQKLKEAETVPVDRKPSVDKVKQIPKTVSPKDSIEPVTLKKTPKRSPLEEKVPQPATPGREKLPLVKEVSPGAVQIKKIPTQPEEEVLEEEFEVKEEAEQDEEAWGWELVPRDSYGSEDWEGEGEDGALEVPGMTRRGEMVAVPTPPSCLQ